MQLSGGMLQRVLIIMAIASNPKILLIDEPTTALESISKTAVLNYLKKLRSDCAVIVVSHDFDVIRQLTDKAVVLYRGQVLEQNKVNVLLDSPSHPYTRALIMASHDINPYKDLWAIQKLRSGDSPCVYYNYCSQAAGSCLTEIPKYNNPSGPACVRGGIVELMNTDLVSRVFKSGSIGEKAVDACKRCSISLNHGEVLSLIGQSGSGKTTLAKIIAGLIPPH